MLSSKVKLFEIARTKLHESGYIYKKGKSRSIVINPPKENQSTREKVYKEEHEDCISRLTEQLVTFKRTFVKKLNGTSSWNSNFNLCDQLSTEVLSFEKKGKN